MGTGKKLQALLKERNISIAQLSRDTGISSNTLYALIKRDSNINTSVMSSIAKSLNMSIDELSNALLEDSDRTVSNPIEPYIISSDHDDMQENAFNLIQRLNKLTADYTAVVYQKNALSKELESRKMMKLNLESKIVELQSELSMLEQRLKNMQLEIELIRDKF